MSLLKHAVASVLPDHLRARLPAATNASTIATMIYTVVMEADIAATGVNSNDIMLLGTLFTLKPAPARVLGSIAHACGGTTLGLFYCFVARQYLPGPPWLRGLLYANFENAGLYGLTRWERLDPGIAAGEVAPYWSKTAFLQGVLRHSIYGAVLGTLDARLSAGSVNPS